MVDRKMCSKHLKEKELSILKNDWERAKKMIYDCRGLKGCED